VVFIGGFGFPWWWGWGAGWGWDYGYPYYGYGYYPYGYGGAYSYGYGGYPYGNGYGAEYQNNYGQNNYGQNNYGQYGDAGKSRVAELQRRLSRAGYYNGSVDGVLGPQTRRAIRAYEADHEKNAS
jgi:hypothetical protein